MKNLSIECNGVSNISCRSYGMTIDLEEVDLSFLDELESSDIIKWKNNAELLKEMDEDEIVEYLISNGYSVEKD